MPLNKREMKLLVDAIEHLTDREKMAATVALAILDDGPAALYIQSWVLPALKALRDNDKRRIAQMASFR